MSAVGIEQQRRDFMRTSPALYDYIEAHLLERVYKHAGDLAGGTLNSARAANRLYARSAKYGELAKSLRISWRGANESYR